MARWLSGILPYSFAGMRLTLLVPCQRLWILTPLSPEPLFHLCSTHAVNFTHGVDLPISSCLQQASALLPSSNPSSSPDLSGVPTECFNFCQVFSKAKATSLPSHHPYDCTVDFLPGTSHHSAHRLCSFCPS